MDRNTDIRFLKGVGEKRAVLLQKLGIDTVGALLRFYPRAYEDWSHPVPIAAAEYGGFCCFRARISTAVRERKVRENMTIYQFAVTDAAGDSMGVTLFNNRYLAERLHFGSTYLFYGKVGGSPLVPELTSPEISEDGSEGIRPIYSATAGMTSKNIAALVRKVVSLDPGEDPLPEELRCRLGLCGLHDAIENIHFPRTEEAYQTAKRRLVFEELFLLQTALLLLKEKARALPGFVLTGGDVSDFASHLPFPLTGAQERVIRDCLSDMTGGGMMNRLVQGDVGSGKTAVAAAICYFAAKDGLKAAWMAPNELLAEQHFNTLSAWLEPCGIRCVLLKGRMKKKERTAIRQQLLDGEAQVAIGTHALLTEDVEFRSLAAVITDEQHRFGVAQRAKLAAKGANPHTLVMSATPIPRTLGLILYGDLDISIIDEYPRGRQKIESYCVDSSYHTRVYCYIQKHLDEGRQGYIVCPMVEEDAESELKSAEEYYTELKDGIFQTYRVGLLHGKMKTADKDAVMRDFQSGAVQLLICTTVIEVGIDVPNAAIMVIENADRFGLSQLHQLRGRIGRGTFKSTCIFISDHAVGKTGKRLEVITKSSDGFYIADEDLKLRGPGDFLGNRQSGLPELRIADLSDDLDLLRLAGEETKKLLENDPHLTAPEHHALRTEVTALYRRMNEN